MRSGRGEASSLSLAGVASRFSLLLLHEAVSAEPFEHKGMTFDPMTGFMVELCGWGGWEWALDGENLPTFPA